MRVFWLDQKIEGGKITNRVHLTRIAEQTGKSKKELFKVPEIDSDLLYLWRYFCDLKNQEPLTYREIEAWQNLTGYELTPGEVKILFVLEQAFYDSRQTGGDDGNGGS